MGHPDIDFRRASPAPAGCLAVHERRVMNRTARLKRLQFRAWHRGTREADLMIGGFFDRHASSWSDEEIAWYETLMEEQDVDIMAWALGTRAVPARFEGDMMQRLQVLDYIEHFE